MLSVRLSTHIHLQDLLSNCQPQPEQYKAATAIWGYGNACCLLHRDAFWELTCICRLVLIVFASAMLCTTALGLLVSSFVKCTASQSCCTFAKCQVSVQVCKQKSQAGECMSKCSQLDAYYMLLVPLTVPVTIAAVRRVSATSAIMCARWLKSVRRADHL